MNNKVLIGVIVVLAAVLVFETVYLLGSKQQTQDKKDLVVKQMTVVPSRHYPAYALFDDIQHWDPFIEMEKMQERMHGMFEDSFARRLMDKNVVRQPAYFEPNISINQKGDTYTVKIDLPGLEKDSINIEVKGQELVVSGERKEEASRQEKGFYRQELNYGSFARIIRLPDDAKTDQITSVYVNGVLVITIPRNIAQSVATSIKVPLK